MTYDSPDLNKASAIQSHINELTEKLHAENRQMLHWITVMNLSEARNCLAAAEKIRSRIKRKQKELVQILGDDSI